MTDTAKPGSPATTSTSKPDLPEAQPSSSGTAGASSITFDEPETEAGAEAIPLGTPHITADATSHTVALEDTTVDDFADHVAGPFEEKVAAFVASHPGARHFLTVAVGLGGAILHSNDANVDAAASAELRALGMLLANRTPMKAGDSVLDTVKAILDKYIPAPAGA